MKSTMDFDVLDSLDELGFTALKNDSKVKEAIDIGAKSIAFTQLIEWFSKQLQALCGLDSYVNSISDPEDSSSFLLEVSSFLKELHCPFKGLVTGPISQRLLDVKSRLALLDFLCTEVQAARLISRKTVKKNVLEFEVEGSNTASSINIATDTLDIKTDCIEDPSVLFTEIEGKIKEKISTNHVVIEEPVINFVLNEQQWEALERLFEDSLHDYSVRRQLLLTRLDVTIQSFKWGEGSKKNEEKILNAYVHKRGKLKKTPSVKLSDLIAARKSILFIEKTSSAELVRNTKSLVNRVRITGVPDRGGRPKEQRPPVEMPNWSKRSGDGGRGRGDNRGRGHQKSRGGKRRGFDAAGTY